MKRIQSCYFGLVFALVLASAACADLAPEELAIIAVKGSRESLAVASYYAKVRKVPKQQILALDVPPAKDLSYSDWQEKVRPQIRSWLGQTKLHGTIRCFVTVWDVPLRIKKDQSEGELAQLARYLSEERASRMDRINGYISALASLAGSGESVDSLGADASLEQIKSSLEKRLAAAQTNVMKQGDGPERQRGLQELQTIFVRSLGMNMMAQSLSRQLTLGGNSNPELRSQFDTFRGRVAGVRQGRAAMEGLPLGFERDSQLLALIEISDGVYGAIAWIDEEQKKLKKNETYSSFDSELSLVAWPSYQGLQWQPNYLHYRFDGSPVRRYRPTYMVSRLEAPTLKRTRQIIDEAIEVEKKGLQGKVYLDARGLAKVDEEVQGGSYKDYDRALLLAEKLFRDHTDMEVVVDKRQALFQPGDCSDAALYCGWYSLAKYIDAFEWVPGSVAYHMASSEARTLRDAESQVWCKRMLEDGVTATIGPAYEPYIIAFPRPNEFFALLLSGKFTLAESFFRCNTFNSWTMVLVGDPLYSPFKASPALKMEGLDPSILRLVEGPPSLANSSETTSSETESTSP